MTDKQQNKQRKKQLLKNYWRQYHAKHCTLEKLEVLEKLWGIWRNLWYYKLSPDELLELRLVIEGSSPKKGQHCYDDMYVDGQDVTHLRNIYSQLESKALNMTLNKTWGQ